VLQQGTESSTFAILVTGVSLFRRLFSADYRAAVAAEAASDLELAAERYALAGENGDAVRVHLARARRADRRDDEIKALRDALHWATDEAAGKRPEIQRALGKALLARAREQGVATARDRERVRAAAAILVEGGDCETAGDALESMGEDLAAARAFERGGLVFRMEAALRRDTARVQRKRTLDDSFAEYEMRLSGGERVRARDALRSCLEVADNKTEYRKLLGDLEGHMIASGRVALRRRGGTDAVLAAGAKIVLGRDALCELPLRSGGISRMHAEIEIGTDADGNRTFSLRDLASRNGTLIGGLPLAGAVPLEGHGSFALGDDCEIEFEVADAPPSLALEVSRGIDRGLTLRAGGEGDLLSVPDIPAKIRFADGRPHLSASSPDSPMLLNGVKVAVGDVELIHGDELSFGGVEVDVK